MKGVKDYKEMLDDNGYINLPVVARFLRQGLIADYEIVAEIFNEGLSATDYNRIQEALDELGYPEEIEQSYKGARDGASG